VVTVEVGAEVFGATAPVVTGEERRCLLDRFAAANSNLARYQAMARCQIPVGALYRGGRGLLRATKR
jgi:hypothetical protein